MENIRNELLSTSWTLQAKVIDNTRDIRADNIGLLLIGFILGIVVAFHIFSRK